MNGCCLVQLGCGRDLEMDGVGKREACRSLSGFTVASPDWGLVDGVVRKGLFSLNPEKSVRTIRQMSIDKGWTFSVLETACAKSWGSEQTTSFRGPEGRGGRHQGLLRGRLMPFPATEWESRAVCFGRAPVPPPLALPHSRG